MAAPNESIMIRPYDTADYDQVVALFIRINRELAPDHMREQFERYIATVIDGELKQLPDIFSAARRNAFWVVEVDGRIVGMFGIEAHDAERTELRRSISTSLIAAGGSRSVCWPLPRRGRASSTSPQWC
jgi:hypothetical protein